jgi:hypothetical protein
MDGSEGASIERTLVVLKPDAVMRVPSRRIPQRFRRSPREGVRRQVALEGHRLRSVTFCRSKRPGTFLYDVTGTRVRTGPVIALALEGADPSRRYERSSVPPHGIPLRPNWNRQPHNAPKLYGILPEFLHVDGVTARFEGLLHAR